MHNTRSTIDRVWEHYIDAANLGHDVLGTFLQGSQNYGLSHAGSDVDTKSLVIPSFGELCRNGKPISYTHVRENNEHIDIKDFRLMFQNFLKQNINMTEILFTECFVVNEEYSDIWEQLVRDREMIVRHDTVRGINCCAGMAYEKMKAMKHPYPSLIDKIEKYGYDPKQLHHIKRMEDFIERFFMNGDKYEDCLKPRNAEYLLMLKTTALPLNEAEILAKNAVDNIDRMKLEYLSLEHEDIEGVEWYLNDIAERILRRAYNIQE